MTTPPGAVGSFSKNPEVNIGSTSPGSLYFAVVGIPAGTQWVGWPGGI